MRRAPALILLGAGLLAGCAAARRSAPELPWPPDAVYPPGDVPRRPASSLPPPAPLPPAPLDPAISRTAGDGPAFPDDDQPTGPASLAAPSRRVATEPKD